MSSKMRFLTSQYAIPIPHPPQMSNKGNYIVSLSQVTSWLGTVAEELGVEVYPGFAGAGIIYSEDGKNVVGVRTNEVGLDRQERMKDTFEPGMEFRAKVTLLAEGAHGSLSKTVINKYDLRAKADLQTYGIGVKEVWRVDPKEYKPGEVIHTIGWPLDWKTYGGGWVYHMGDGMVSLGLVIGLDYANPYLSPYRELQVRPLSPLFLILLDTEYDNHLAFEVPPIFHQTPLGRLHPHRIRGSRNKRRRPPIHPTTPLPRRRADRMQCRFRERRENKRDS
jgi:electron-transferring-flavoprotein dehydrogenase